MKNMFIKIVMSNGTEIKWVSEQWDDYEYDGEFFIIKKNGSWIGFYNLDFVISIIVKEEI